MVLCQPSPAAEPGDDDGLLAEQFLERAADLPLVLLQREHDCVRAGIERVRRLHARRVHLMDRPDYLQAGAVEVHYRGIGAEAYLVQVVARPHYQLCERGELLPPYPAYHLVLDHFLLVIDPG